MPRYLLEARTRDEGILATAERDEIVERNLMASVTWLCSFVGERRTYALYEGPHPEAVRRVAGAAGLDVSHVSEVQLLDPYAYLGRPVPEREEHR